jgi:hypothetical protein
MSVAPPLQISLNSQALACSQSACLNVQGLGHKGHKGSAGASADLVGAEGTGLRRAHGAPRAADPGRTHGLVRRASWAVEAGRAPLRLGDAGRALVPAGALGLVARPAGTAEAAAAIQYFTAPTRPWLFTILAQLGPAHAAPAAVPILPYPSSCPTLSPASLRPDFPNPRG